MSHGHHPLLKEMAFFEGDRKYPFKDAMTLWCRNTTHMRVPSAPAYFVSFKDGHTRGLKEALDRALERGALKGGLERGNLVRIRIRTEFRTNSNPASECRSERFRRGTARRRTQFGAGPSGSARLGSAGKRRKARCNASRAHDVTHMTRRVCETLTDPTKGRCETCERANERKREKPP